MTISDAPALPAHSALNIGGLARLYASTATSYKFLWTLSLLAAIKADELTSVGAAGDKSVPINHVFDRMLAIAASPLQKFHLSFGTKDRMGDHLASLAENDKTRPRVYRELSQYVPHKWLSPFLPETYAAAGMRRIRALCEDKFASGAVPYMFADIGKTITLHHRWLAYFSDNMEILRGWTLWHWGLFLQKHNPFVPAIMCKLTAPESRPALTEQRGFWYDIMSRKPLNCIYSARQIDMNNFALDHYLPYALVAHDSLWNLVPTFQDINSSKSDQIPDNRYLDGLIAQHHEALRIHKENFSRKYKNLLSGYTTDLLINREDLQDAAALRAAYRRFIPKWMDMADSDKFSPHWKY